jgi:hypothetical protein
MYTYEFLLDIFVFTTFSVFLPSVIQILLSPTSFFNPPPQLPCDMVIQLPRVLFVSISFLYIV